MSSIEKPKLRELNAFPVNADGRQMICLQDPLHFTENPVFVPENAFFIITLFDGENTVLDIQEQFMRKYGSLLMSDQIRKVIDDLDSNLMLESDRFEEYKKQVTEDFARSSLRLAIHSGKAFESDPELLKYQFASYFAQPEGPGQPDPESLSHIKGIVSPHIDFERGGFCYAWAYKEIIEKSDADLFVIFGTSHAPSKNHFILTNKDFQTPLGIASTDKNFISSILEKYKVNLFEDELIHKIEHSIEFQVVFLQYILGERDYQIIPILCSSFHKIIEENKLPSEVSAFSDFISAVRETISQSGRSVCFIAGADLTHVGKRFGDQIDLSSTLLRVIEMRDTEMLAYVEKLDADGFYTSIQKDGDDRKICGLPPIYTMLKVMDASNGKLLKYYQAHEYDTDSVVSFASLSFE